MKYLVGIAAIILLACSLGAQEQADYSAASRWLSGIVLTEGKLIDPVVAGDQVLVLSEEGVVLRVDISDVHDPVELPPLTTDEPINHLFGPFAGHVYLAGTERLEVLDAATLSRVALLDYPSVRHMLIDGDIAALLVDDGSLLVTADGTQPAVLPSLGTMTESLEFREAEYVARHDNLLLLSRGAFNSGATIVDISNPDAPTFVRYFGWSIDMMEMVLRSEITETGTFRAFSNGSVHTMEYYRSTCSPYVETDYANYISPWDFTDLNNPIHLERMRPAAENLGTLAPVFLVRGDELVNAIRSRIITTNLDVGQASAAIKVGLGADQRIRGLADAGEYLIASTSAGTVHVIQDRRPDGPTLPTAIDDKHTCAALGGGHFITGSRWYEGSDEWLTRFKLYDASTPESPVLITDDFSLDSERCLVSETHHAFFRPRLSVKRMGVSGSFGYGWNARDLCFISSEIAALANEDGLFIIDISNPDSATVLVRPDTQPVEEVTVVHQDDAETVVAGLWSSGFMTIYSLADPSQPELLSFFATEFDGLVDVEGTADGLLAGLKLGVDDWPGYTLQILDAHDPANPRLRGECPLPGEPIKAWRVAGKLYLACGPAGMLIVDVSDLDAPMLTGGLGTDAVDDVRIEDGKLLLAGSDLFTLPVDIGTEVAVQIQDYQVQAAGQGVDISWKVMSGPVDISHFRLQACQGNVERRIEVGESEGNWSGRDEDPDWGRTRYELWISDSEGAWTQAAAQVVDLIPPAATRLLPPGPNPFNPAVTLKCELRVTMSVTIGIHDARGHLVRTLVDETVPAGLHTYIWNGLDDGGRGLPSGMYIARLSTLDGVQHQKLSLVR